jgi:FKBP-type peptidyl-prolyl cis-trans isomerase FklB
MNHKEEGEKYLAQNAKYDDVKVTPSGLQYTIKKQGNGPKPGPNDTVEVNYHGTFINNKAFDSTYSGDPVIFSLDSVIAGWTEGLQLMPVGSIYKFYIPYNLAYGEEGYPGTIPPYATLIFEIELLAIKS